MIDRGKGKKALIVTTVSGFVPQFEMNNVRILQELGYEVHYASNFKNPSYGSDNRRLDGTGIICHQVDMARSPFRFFSLCRAYCQLKGLMQENSFALVHCHTPVGGALARMAAAFVRNSTYNHENSFVIYTAHGFHFYKGAPLINWLLYYPAERLLARYTDALITMNKEDYRRAGKFHLRQTGAVSEGRRVGGKAQVYRINGVGIDAGRYRWSPAERAGMRRKLGIAENEFLLLSVGELSKRKNHQAVIQALAQMTCESGIADGLSEAGEGRIKYLIAGEGGERGKLERLIRKRGLGDRVRLLGYRTDVRELLAAADCFVFPSKQEGLPVALMEAMAAGLPCIAADIRGCRELLGKDELVKKNCPKEYERAISKAYAAFRKCRIQAGKAETEKKTGQQAAGGAGEKIRQNRRRRKVMDRISAGRVTAQMKEIYTVCLLPHTSAG